MVEKSPKEFSVFKRDCRSPISGTDNQALRQTPLKTIAERYKKAGSFKTKYWTPEMHKAAFALPRFIADLVDRARVKKRK